MTWGRTTKKALESSKIATTFADWTKIAQDRAKWRKPIIMHYVHTSSLSTGIQGTAEKGKAVPGVVNMGTGLCDGPGSQTQRAQLRA